MDIRPIVAGEEHQVIALWQDCGLTRAWNDPKRDLDFARGKTNSTVLIGHLDQKIMASVMVGHDGHRGNIYYLAVAPQHQGKGFGRAMLQSAETWLVAKGIWKLNLTIRAGNTKVVGFYERFGYEEEDVVMLGRWIDPTKKGE